jgi:hypothetical protein
LAHLVVKRPRGEEEGGMATRRILLNPRLYALVAASLEPATAAFPGAIGKIAFATERHGFGSSEVGVMNADGHQCA